MSDLSAIISGLNLLGLGGVGVFIYYLFKGLTQKIKTLTEISEEQEKTLAVVRDRALELEKWREEYKRMVSDFQDIGSKLDQRRNNLVQELEDANRRKDAEVAELKTAQLKEIELRQKSFQRAQELEKELSSAKTELDRQIQILQPWEIGKQWAKIPLNTDNQFGTLLSAISHSYWFPGCETLLSPPPSAVKPKEDSAH